MKNFEIEDTKEFIEGIKNNEKYDSFYLYEARIKGRLDYYVNGRQNREYFDTEVAEEVDEYISWGEIKQSILALIQGDKPPLSFKIILMFNRDNIEKLIDMNKLGISSSEVSALMYNIYYEEGKLYVTTGTSLRIFTLDKTLETLWEDTVERYYL